VAYKHRILLLVQFFLLFIISCYGKESRIEELIISNSVIRVEIADTEEKRSTGLMNRKSLDYDSGMLFVYQSDRKLSFWMKNTLIPLSIAFISSDGTIKEILDMEPLSLNPVVSRYSVRYALEVNRGYFEEKNIKPGDKVIFPDSIRR
jgi:hypothetical protein